MNKHVAEGLIWASLCAAVLKRFLAHAAQLVGGKPISTRRVAMCARHIVDELSPRFLFVKDSLRLSVEESISSSRMLVAPPPSAIERPDAYGPVSTSSGNFAK